MYNEHAPNCEPPVLKCDNTSTQHVLLQAQQVTVGCWIDTVQHQHNIDIFIDSSAALMRIINIVVQQNTTRQNATEKLTFPLKDLWESDYYSIATMFKLELGDTTQQFINWWSKVIMERSFCTDSPHTGEQRILHKAAGEQYCPRGTPHIILLFITSRKCTPKHNNITKLRPNLHFWHISVSRHFCDISSCGFLSPCHFFGSPLVTYGPTSPTLTVNFVVIFTYWQIVQCGADAAMCKNQMSITVKCTDERSIDPCNM